MNRYKSLKLVAERGVVCEGDCVMNYPTRARLRGQLVAALALVGCLAPVSLLAATSAHASGYGELQRFPGKGTNGKGKEFVLSGKEAHAFTANPETGASYVGDETTEHSEDLRIQTYSAAGAFEGEGIIKEHSLPSGPGGFEGLEEYEGFALDAKEKRLYVLATYTRFSEDDVDPGATVAGSLYALNSTPGASGKLEPAANTGKEGILGTTSTLGGDSETQGQALLEPSGITVDPLTGEVLILGLVDEGGGKLGRKLHTAVMHVSSSGVVQYTWVDPAETTEGEAPNSPVVSPEGELFFEGGNELFAMPADAHEGEPKLVFEFADPEQFKTGPFAGEILSFGEAEGTSSGGGLSLVGEGTKEGRIVALAEPYGVTEAGELKEKRNGVLSFHYTEAGGSVTVAELGWTGGVAGEGPPEKSSPCEIGFANGTPSVAAVTGDAIDMLAPAWPEVIKFGSGGSGCLAAKPVSVGKEETLEATIDGKRISEAEMSDTVTLTGKVVQGNVLSVKWNFGDGQEAQTTTPAGEQTQTVEIAHKFVKSGDLSITATVYTDNLADPELHVETHLKVLAEAEEPPKVLRQPKPVTVTEGEPATFEATASGEPTPTEQWEVSTDGGSTWTPLTGQTAPTLTLQDVSPAQDDYQYRAKFKNTAGEATSNAAKLTVDSKPAQQAPHEPTTTTTTTTTTATGQQEASGGVAGLKEASPRATLAGTAVGVSSSGALTLQVRCPAGVVVCTGTVTLRTASAVSAGHGKRKHVLTLATGSFSVHGGQAQAVKLHLSAEGRSLLAHGHLLRTVASIVAHNEAGETQSLLTPVTLRLAKAR